MTRKTVFGPPRRRRRSLRSAEGARGGDRPRREIKSSNRRFLSLRSTEMCRVRAPRRVWRGVAPCLPLTRRRRLPPASGRRSPDEEVIMEATDLPGDSVLEREQRRRPERRRMRPRRPSGWSAPRARGRRGGLLAGRWRLQRGTSAHLSSPHRRRVCRLGKRDRGAGGLMRWTLPVLLSLARHCACRCRGCCHRHFHCRNRCYCHNLCCRHRHATVHCHFRCYCRRPPRCCGDSDPPPRRPPTTRTTAGARAGGQTTPTTTRTSLGPIPRPSSTPPPVRRRRRTSWSPSSPPPAVPRPRPSPRRRSKWDGGDGEGKFGFHPP